MYYHKYQKYKKKYLLKKRDLQQNRPNRQVAGGRDGDPTRSRVPDSYANYSPSPSGARALQAQLYKQMGNAQVDSAKSKSQMTTGSSSISSPADPQRAGEMVESCLTSCMKDCNYGFPLCISTNMGSFAQTARNLQSLMGAQKGPSGSSSSASSGAGAAAGAGAGAGDGMNF